MIQAIFTSWPSLRATLAAAVVAAAALSSGVSRADEPVTGASAATAPAAAAISATANAKTPADAPKLSVEEILQRNAAARGGIDAWHKVRTIVQIGHIERNNEIPGMTKAPKADARLAPDAINLVAFRQELARPNKMRTELSFRGATAIQAFDGKEGFTVQPGPSGAVARPFSEAQLRAAAEQLDLEGPLLGAAAQRTIVTLDGVESVRERPAYKLLLQMKNGVTRHVWVDAQSFLDVKIDGTRQIGDRVWPIETSFDDFRKVDKVQIPYRIETAVGGVHQMESVHLFKVVLNSALENSLFTLPRAPAAADK